MNRTASAVWQGDVRNGKGTISTPSGVLHNTQYSFNTRFEEGVGTNPEELIGAAHAGCFSMALSWQLGVAGLVPQRIATTATVTLDKVGEGWAVTMVHLDVTVHIPGAEQAAFQNAALTAKETCPLSNLFNAAITMDAKLVAEPLTEPQESAPQESAPQESAPQESAASGSETRKSETQKSGARGATARKVTSRKSASRKSDVQVGNAPSSTAPDGEAPVKGAQRKKSPAARGSKLTSPPSAEVTEAALVGAARQEAL